MMRVVLDTSVICPDYRMDGPAFRLLFAAAHPLGYAIHVPGPVMDELRTKYVREVRRLARDVGRLSHLLPRAGDSTVCTVDVEEAAQQYEKWVALLCLTSDLRILEYPATPHRAMVARELSQKKPFSESGRGYRDALIWETVLRLAQQEGPAIALISADLKAFADSDRGREAGVAALHRDLLDDMQARDLDPGRVVLFDRLDRFIEHHVTPSLRRLDDLRAQLAEDRHPSLNLQQWLEAYLPDALVHFDLGRGIVDLPSEFENPTISAVLDIGPVSVGEVRQVAGEEVLIEAMAEFECEIDVYVFKADYWTMDESEQPRVWDDDWNKHYVAASDTVTGTATVHLIYDCQAHQVTSAEVYEVEGSRAQAVPRS